MKTTMHHSPINLKAGMALWTILLTFANFNSCKKEVNLLEIPKFHRFDVMKQKIEERIGDKCVGMSCTVIQTGVVRFNTATGQRRLQSDGGNLPYNIGTRQTTFSTTKTIVAAATYAVLKKEGLTVDEPIKPYFPNSWDVSNVPDDLTFAHLLRHRSGFIGTYDDYDGMKNYIETGIFNTMGNYKYANINYTLLRILVPMLYPFVRNLVNNSPSTGFGSNIPNEVTSTSFITLVRQTVTTPSGINPNAGPMVWDMDDPNLSCRLYNYQNQTIPGTFILADNKDLHDFTWLCGGGGWYLNTLEMATFIDKHLRGELSQLIDADVIKQRRLGVFYDHNSKPGVGKIYLHLGSSGTALGGRSLWIYLEDFKITLVLFINSGNNDPSIELDNNLYDTVIDIISESYY